MATTSRAGQAGILLPALASAVLCISPIGSKAQSAVMSTPTNVVSNTDLLISYRHQEHLWQTSDGSLHLLLNRGRQTTNPGLTLMSSYDGGSNWTVALNWPDAGIDTTADGQQTGDSLDVVYSTAVGGIAHAQLGYDATRRSWSRTPSRPVFAASAAFTAENPTVTVDATGRRWAAYVASDAATGSPRINVAYRDPGSSTWTEAGLVFGGIGAPRQDRSARLLTVPGGVGMLYRIEGTSTWAWHAVGSPDDQAWQETMILTSRRAGRGDPAGSHFSVATDSRGVRHLLTADDSIPYYLVYLADQGRWSTPRPLDANVSTSYSQLTVMADDRLVAVYNNSSGDSRVQISADGGATWALTAILRPTPVDGATYTYARVETASRSTWPLAGLRQYAESRKDKLMLFLLPAP
jgi:hypothetical protein